ncbi:hypothetical protein B5X24_HaOG209134 [Helicoverpa armigera]|nr:hypothetical protein B5X24_HaOG209134 [Helicoverpa armigera]
MAVAVGYTPLTDTSKYYNTWYTVALKSREADILGEICFAAVTSEELAAELGVESVPNARLMLWNDTKEYISRDGDLQAWNHSSLMHWVLDNFSQPVARIMPLWRKAFNFERYVDGNPILILFTPLNPLYEQLPSYALMREVAMEYYNCKGKPSSQWTSELQKLQQVQRLMYQQKNYTKFCNEFKFKKPIRKQSRFFKRGVESQNNKYPWYNSTHKHHKNGVFNFLLKRGFTTSKAVESVEESSQLLSSLDWLQECGMKALPAERSFYEHYEQCQSFEESFNHDHDVPEVEEVETTMLPFEDDPLSPDNLLQDSVKHFCKVFRFAQEWGAPIYPSRQPDVDERRINITHIEGLSCARNFSLHIIAVDSVRNHHFAESLGIDISNKKDMTAVVILDSKHESQYVLSEEYNAKSIREFISNFTNKDLKRSLRSHVYDTAHTHYFGSDGETAQMGISNTSVYIEDLTSRGFRRMVKTPGTMTLVAVCGGACSALTSRALWAARRLLAPRGEADSQSYPSEERVTAAGVVALALRSLAAPQHLRVRLALCSAVQSLTDKRICLKDIKEHVTSVIGRNLKYWRQVEDNELKEALFKRLQHLHTLALDLSLFHITDLSPNCVKQTSLLDSLSILAKNWDIDISVTRNNATVTSLRERS